MPRLSYFQIPFRGSVLYETLASHQDRLLVREEHFPPDTRAVGVAKEQVASYAVYIRNASLPFKYQSGQALNNHLHLAPGTTRTSHLTGSDKNSEICTHFESMRRGPRRMRTLIS